MYMIGYKCNVTGARSTTAIATAKPPVWCEDNTSKCVRGAKQMIYWNQVRAVSFAVKSGAYSITTSWRAITLRSKGMICQETGSPLPITTNSDFPMVC
jgi:hypothetical protein